jgi:hypothetical protein
LTPIFAASDMINPLDAPVRLQHMLFWILHRRIACMGKMHPDHTIVREIIAVSHLQ